MGNTRRKPVEETPRRRGRPARTPEDRENQLISLAVDTAEKQMQDGTASAQVITHYLKLGSTREQVEKQKLRNEARLVEARIEAMESQKRTEELYENALSAMRRYSGQGEEEYDEQD